MSDGLGLRVLGSTGLEVTPLCVGTSPLGNTPLPYARDVPEDDAVATVRRALASPINFLDTGNNYGDAERRIGIVLREHGGIPDGFVLADEGRPRHEQRATSPATASGGRSRRAWSGSGSTGSALVHLHDPENISFEEGVAPGGPLEALQALKEEGVIAHLGVAGGPIDLLRRYIRTGAFSRRAHAQPLLADRHVGRAAVRGGAGARRRRAQRGAVRRRRARGRAAGAGLLRLPGGGPGDPRADRGAARRLRAPRRPARRRRGPVLHPRPADRLDGRRRLEARARRPAGRARRRPDPAGAVGRTQPPKREGST